MRGAALLALLALGAAAGAQARLMGDGIPAPPPQCSAEIRSKTNWGVATAAYQVEGAWNQGGRSPSIWDTFSQTPNNIKNNDTGDVACDMYHKYPQDFALMKELGIKHYRFSFSWSRVLPGGVAGSPVNPEGVKFYNDMIDAMIAAGVKPYATLFHWDLPQVLQDKYEGFIGDQIVDDYLYYADVLFKHFGDRVANWMTFNEPWITCALSYGWGTFAPGIAYGDAGMFKCGHHLLLAHGKAFQLYHSTPQAHLGGATYASQHPAGAGKIGIALNIEYTAPLTDSPVDIAAAAYGLEKNLGWFADPLFFGDYPASLKACAGSNLPAFTPEQSALVKGSLDFLGINFYTGKYAKGDPKDKCAVATLEQDAAGKDIGPLAESAWLRVVPWSIYKLLTYVNGRYKPAEVVITENGVSAPKEQLMSTEQAVRDTFRVDFYSGYLDNLCKAIAEGVNVSTYFAWSFMDNFEWREGYTQRFGITHVAFDTPELARTVKDSGRFLSKHFFTQGRGWQQQ